MSLPARSLRLRGMQAIMRHHGRTLMPRERLIELIWMVAAARGVYDPPGTTELAGIQEPTFATNRLNDQRWPW